MFPNDEAKWAWLAALIDGEGSLGLRKNGGKWYKEHKSGRGFCWQVMIDITNKSRPLLETAFTVIGHGSIHRPSPKTRPEVWRLVVASNGIRFILPKVLPYLIVKKEQAHLVLEALELLKKQQGQRRYNLKHYGMRAPFDKRLEEIYYEIRNLNN